MEGEEHPKGGMYRVCMEEPAREDVIDAEGCKERRVLT